MFFFTQKTAYERRISDWSSDVCSSDLRALSAQALVASGRGAGSCQHPRQLLVGWIRGGAGRPLCGDAAGDDRHCRAARARTRRLAGLFRPLCLPPGRASAGAFAGGTPWRAGAAGEGPLRPHPNIARKSVVEGKSVSVRVDLGGRRIITKKNKTST